MTALLTEHMPLVASAPNGVKKLRELILQLAVMGKLVPQDPSDEPARKLFEQILVDRGRCQLGKKLCSVTSFDSVRQEEKKFSLPSSWIWARFGELTVNRDSERVPVASELRLERRGIYDYYGASGVIDTIDDFLFDKPLLLIGEDGANLINRSTPIAFIAKGKYWVNNHAHVLDTTEPILMLYLALYINAISLLPYITGTAQPKMNQAKMNQIPVPLPPLAEQHRIVAKVDELMALCDRLDAQQSDAAAAHKHLVAALLNTLTQSIDQSDFATKWERIKQSFDTIFTTESSIDVLKQTLLQLAVMGKLVPQDARDEPASELLEKIRQEKLVRVGKKKSAKESRWMPVSNKETPFVLPESWVWAKIEDYSSFTEYGISEKTFELTSGIPVIKMGDIQGGKVKLFGQKMVDSDCEVIFLKHHDVLYNRTNSAELVGKSGIFEGPDDTYTFASYLIRIQCLKGLSSPYFLNLAMNTPGFRETQINPHVKQQCGQANVNGTILKSMLIPVPPLTEQHRIVAKVDELMALCDNLKKSLCEVRVHQELLSTVIVEKAISNDMQPQPAREVSLAV